MQGTFPYNARNCWEFQVELSWGEHAYYNVITNSTLGGLYTRNAKALGVSLIEQFQGTLGGSTDMGNVSHKVPAIHPIFHLGSDAKCHTKEFATVAGMKMISLSPPLRLPNSNWVSMCEKGQE